MKIVYGIGISFYQIHQYQLKLEKANGIIKKANVMKQDYLKLKEEMIVKENEVLNDFAL